MRAQRADSVQVHVASYYRLLPPGRRRAYAVRPFALLGAVARVLARFAGWDYRGQARDRPLPCKHATCNTLQHAADDGTCNEERAACDTQRMSMQLWLTAPHIAHVAQAVQ